MEKSFIIEFYGTDGLAGYEIGLNQGRRLLAGHLSDREPPEHFCLSRRIAWGYGYRAGLRDRAKSRSDKRREKADKAWQERRAAH